jgi:hypothetical protein
MRWLSRLRCAAPHNKRMNPTSSGDQALPTVGLRRLSLAGYARPRWAANAWAVIQDT